MEVGVLQPSPEDPKLIEEVINRLKSQGIFDDLRKSCLADVDTKPAYQNLTRRVESYVSKFLEEQTWSPDLNKNQLRDGLRKQINQSGMLASGVDRVIEQVVQPKIYKVFKPEIDKVMCEVLGIDPKEREENEKKRQELIVKYQQQQQFLQKNAHQIQQQQQGFQGQLQQQFFQGNATGIRPQGVPNTNFPPPMMPPQGFNQFQNQQGMQTIQTARGPMPLMQINTLAAQQTYSIPQNYNQASYQANLLLAAQQQALVRAGLQSMGITMPQQNLMQQGIMQQASTMQQPASTPAVPGLQINQQFNPQLALATSKAQQIAMQTSKTPKQGLSQTQSAEPLFGGLPKTVISSAFSLPSTAGTMPTTFSPMTTSSPRASKTPATPGTPGTTAGMTPGTPSTTAAGASPGPSHSPALPTSPPPLPPLPETDIKKEKPRTPEPASPIDAILGIKKDSKDTLKLKEKLEKKSSSQLPFAVKEKSKLSREGSLSRDSPKLEKMKRMKDGSSSRASPTLEKIKREDSSRESSPKSKHTREGSSSRDSPKSDAKMKSKSDKYKESSRDVIRSDKLGHEIKLKKEGLSAEKLKQKEERLRILGEKVERKLQEKREKSESREKYKEKERLSSGKIKIGDRVLGPKVPAVVPLPAEGKIMIGDRVLGPKIPADDKLKMKSVSDRDRLKFIEKQKLPGGDKYSALPEKFKDGEKKMLGERSEKHKSSEKYKMKHEKIKDEFGEHPKMSSKGEKMRPPGEKRKGHDLDNVKTSGALKSMDMFGKTGFKKSKSVVDPKRDRADSEPKRPKEIPLEKVRPGEDPRLKDIYWGRDEERLQKERYAEGHRSDPRLVAKERRKTVEGSERSKHSKDSHGERDRHGKPPKDYEKKHSGSSSPTSIKTKSKSKKKKKSEKGEKKYDFAWNKIKSDQLSDISVSSVHTSDLSSFEYDMSDFETDAAEMNKRKQEAGLPVKQEPMTSKEPPPVAQSLGDDYEPLSESEDEGVYKEETLPEPPKPPPPPEKKPVSQREKDRQRRRAEIEAKLRELDDRKKQLQEECRKLKRDEKTKAKEGKAKEEAIKKEDTEEGKRPVQQSKLKKTKQELKDHLREQKVFEKKMALRRQRAPNKRYTSEDFTSIFSEGQKFYKENRRGEMLVTSSSETSRSRSATPTQDEQHYLPQGKAIAKTEQNIPIYEVQSPQKTRPSNLGPFFPGGTTSPGTGTSMSLKDDDYYEKISSGDSILNSPNSEISEAKSDDFLDDTPEKPDKKHKSASPMTMVETEQKRSKPRPETPIDITEKPISKTPPLSSARSTTSRYDLSDLYKPRTSHRRGSPIRTAAEDVPPAKIVKEELPKSVLKEEKVHKEKKQKVDKYSPPKPDAAKPSTKYYAESDLAKPRLTFLSSGRRRRSRSSKGSSSDMATTPEKELIDAHRVFSSKHSPGKLKGKKRPRSLSPLAWTNSLLARPSAVKRAAKGRPRKRAKLAPPSRERTPEPAGRVVRRRATTPSESSSRPSTPELTIDEQAESMTGSLDSRPSTPRFRPRTPPGEPPPDDDAPEPPKAPVAMKMSDVVALLRKEEADLAAKTHQSEITSGRSTPGSDPPTPTMDEPSDANEMDIDQSLVISDEYKHVSNQGAGSSKDRGSALVSESIPSSSSHGGVAFDNTASDSRVENLASGRYGARPAKRSRGDATEMERETLSRTMSILVAEASNRPAVPFGAEFMGMEIPEMSERIQREPVDEVEKPPEPDEEPERMPTPTMMSILVEEAAKRPAVPFSAEFIGMDIPEMSERLQREPTTEVAKPPEPDSEPEFTATSVFQPPEPEQEPTSGIPEPVVQPQQGTSEIPPPVEQLPEPEPLVQRPMSGIDELPEPSKEGDPTQVEQELSELEEEAEPLQVEQATSDAETQQVSSIGVEERIPDESRSESEREAVPSNEAFTDQDVSGAEQMDTEQSEIVSDDVVNDTSEGVAVEVATRAVEEAASTMDECPSALDILAVSALSAAGSFTAHRDVPSEQERSASPDDAVGITLVDVSGNTEFCTIGDAPKSVISFSEQTESESEAAPVLADTTKSSDEDYVENLPVVEKSVSSVEMSSEEEERSVSQVSVESAEETMDPVDTDKSADEPPTDQSEGELAVEGPTPAESFVSPADRGDDELAVLASSSEVDSDAPVQTEDATKSCVEDTEAVDGSEDRELEGGDVEPSDVEQRMEEEEDSLSAKMVSEEQTASEPEAETLTIAEEPLQSDGEPSSEEKQLESEAPSAEMKEKEKSKTVESTTQSEQETSDAEKETVEESLQETGDDMEEESSETEQREQESIETEQQPLETKEESVEMEEQNVEQEEEKTKLELDESGNAELDSLVVEEDSAKSDQDEDKVEKLSDIQLHVEQTESESSDVEQESSDMIQTELSDGKTPERAEEKASNSEQTSAETVAESLSESEHHDEVRTAPEPPQVEEVRETECAEQMVDDPEQHTVTEIEKRETLPQDDSGSSEQLEERSQKSPVPEKCQSPVDDSADCPDSKQPESDSEDAEEPAERHKSRHTSRASVMSEDPVASPRSVSPGARSESPSLRRSRRQSRASAASEDMTTSPTRSESPAVHSRPGTPAVMPHVGPPTPPVVGRSSSPSSSRTSTPTSETRRGRRKQSESQLDIAAVPAPRVRRAASPTVKRTSLRSYSPPPHYGTRRAGKTKPEKPEKKSPAAPAKKPKLSSPTVSPPARATRGQKPAAAAATRGRGKPAAVAQAAKATGKRASRGSKDDGPPSKRGKH